MLGKEESVEIRKRLANILREHANNLRQLERLEVAPVSGDSGYLRAYLKTRGEIEKMFSHDPKTIAEELEKLAERLESGKVKVHLLEDPKWGEPAEEAARKQYLIQFDPDNPLAFAEYRGGKLHHSAVSSSPFAWYDDGSAHIVVDNGYVKAKKKEERVEYELRPIPHYSGIRGPVVFVRYNGKTYVINPYRVLIPHPELK